MGFPLGYQYLLFPKLFVNFLSLLGFIRNLILIFFRYLGLHHFLQPDPPPEFQSLLILSVVKFSELEDPVAESCSVCLYDFEADEEIRRLRNCRHIFHKGCLDRWIGYDQRTCPLCRTPFIPDHVQGAFNESLWFASGFPEFYSQYPHINAF